MRTYLQVLEQDRNKVRLLKWQAGETRDRSDTVWVTEHLMHHWTDWRETEKTTK